MNAQDLARYVFDAVEPMVLRVRREQQERQEKFEEALQAKFEAGMRVLIREMIQEVLAMPARMGQVSSFVVGIVYLAGSIVTHRGGTWQALDNTSSEPGDSGLWRLLANGLTDIGGFMSEDDPRLLTLQHHLASGDTINLEVRLPCPIHRGLWRADAVPYQQGDEVAWNGSSWRAVRETTACPPGPDWLLVAQAARTREKS